ncbi:GlcNAc-PI de-N-acetylase [Auraticoccus sp. F435]|uniref:GlcNAc-PI de-N-acetylase n=1 Tax=Auraticoccus cholistanensis TaxID=2656650 RepID=A0A6A9V1V7_9ACTN|nr:PIG-L family deacetylase [Auraticoccus cholistanensis]MVA77578.1 GlcNAc-PI de-N-acetylase [Auraticoccus cholistanensis]
MSLLDVPGPVLLVHAHPDDETLATGALIAHLTARGTEVAVLTATRGEMGEVVPGSLPADIGPDQLDAAREAELAGALAELGVQHAAFLGTPPARVPGLPPRRYRDSGMRWVTPIRAGAALESDHRSLTAAALDDVVADLCAWVEVLRPSLLIGYDVDGSYGHPDHVRCHHATAAAARRCGLPALEVVSGEQADDAEWLELAEQLPVVLAALRHHASQVTVRTRPDGRPEVEHVGGQRQDVLLRTGLRRMV